MAIVETLEVRFKADMGNLGMQLNALGAQVNALSSTLDAGKGRLSASAAGLIEGIANGLRISAYASAAPEQAGDMLSGRFAQRILNGRAAAASAARQLSAAANFSNQGAVSCAQSAGAALGQGFVRGIASQYGAVMRAANRIANAAANRIRSALKIHSPSRVSFELGGFFTEGFAEGIYASLNKAEESVSALSNMTRSALTTRMVTAPEDGAGLMGMVQTAVGSALGNTSIVIPLNVDGMKLGEASIRGINRVTRSTGRVMLEI